MILLRCPFVLLLLSFASVGLAVDSGDISTSPPDDDGPPTTTCNGTTIDAFYEVEIELFAVPDECEEEDWLNMGALIQSLVCEADDRIPDYKEEYMKTDVCEAPEEESEVGRFLRSSPGRNLGRYSKLYLGAGHCRRCYQDDGDGRGDRYSEYRRYDGSGSGSRDRERTLGSSKEKNGRGDGIAKKRENDSDGSDSDIDDESIIDVRELTSEMICKMARTAMFQQNMAEATDKHANGVILEIIDIVKEAGTESRTQKLVDHARKRLEVLSTATNMTSIAAELSVVSCKEAMNTKSKGKLMQLAKETRKASNAAKIASRRARMAVSKLKDILIAAKEEVYKPNFTSRGASMKGAKRLIKSQEELQKLADGLHDKIDKLGQKIKHQSKGSKKKELKQELDELEQEAADIKDSMALSEQALDEEAKWEQELAQARSAVAAADTDVEWSENFSDLLSLWLPRHLLENYNSTSSGLGCLATLPIVEVYMFESEDDSLHC